MKFLKIAGAGLLLLILAAGAGLYWMADQLAPDVVQGAEAPQVSFTGLEGEEIALADLRGQVVLLEFWGST